MDQESAIDTEALNSVLAWAAYADSVDKLNFLKSFCLSLGLEELSKLKRITAHVRQRADVRKRKWTGITWDDYKDAKKISMDHHDQGKEVTAKLKPTVSPTVELKLDPIPLPKPWWDQLDFVAIDVEKVAKFIQDGNGKVIGHTMKAAKVGVVDSTYKTVIKADIYHAAGTFNTHPKTVRITGIRRNDMINGENLESVVEKVRRAFTLKTVITVAGQNDFESLESTRHAFDSSLYEDTFDLQEFYRRPSKNDPFGTEPMSLRDICFYHFKEDIQFSKPHDVIDDAKNTMRAFLEGYIPWKMVNGNPMVRRNIENVDFQSVPNLKRYEEQNKYYCKPSNEFRENCPCNYCKKYKCLQRF